MRQDTSNGTRPAGETHALVVGGSMAGLLAARVLSDYFDRVTIVERDPLPDSRAGASRRPDTSTSCCGAGS
jgi:phytoene dehydrogenase-like protein